MLSKIPMVGQAVLGFILPWILAMIAVPLEMLVESGRPVIGQAFAFAIGAGGILFRVAGHVVRYSVAVLTHAYDIYIILPLHLERLVSRRAADASNAVFGTPTGNSAERTVPMKVPR